MHIHGCILDGLLFFWYSYWVISTNHDKYEFQCIPTTSVAFFRLIMIIDNLWYKVYNYDNNLASQERWIDLEYWHILLS